VLVSVIVVALLICESWQIIYSCKCYPIYSILY